MYLLIFYNFQVFKLDVSVLFMSVYIFFKADIQDKTAGRSTLCTTSCVQSLPAVEITEFYSDSIMGKVYYWQLSHYKYAYMQGFFSSGFY